MENTLFQVATFNADESKEEVLQGGLSFNEAKVIALKLWESNKFHGVEILDEDIDNMEPIVWIKSKH